MEQKVTYDYPRPALTVDCVVFGLDQGDLKVLLIKRAREPFKDRWALPGGFVEMDESIEMGARRELEEETGVRDVFLEQLYTFGAPGRDPRGRVVTVAYYALVNICSHNPRAASDAREAGWFPVAAPPPLAFDHHEILAMAHRRLKGKISYQPIGFELLPSKFTLSELQHLYEVILEKQTDKRNFRRKILSMGILEEAEEVQKGVRHRAARLYRFDKKKYEALIKEGFSFEI
ncbi:MAG: NUDIX hydrolase [bacterium]|nr:NUDIX hydrolase [bacterium]